MNKKKKKRIPASNIKPSNTREECHKYGRFGGLKRLGSCPPFGFGRRRQTLHLVDLQKQERDGDREDWIWNAEMLVFRINVSKRRGICLKGNINNEGNRNGNWQQKEEGDKSLQRESRSRLVVESVYNFWRSTVHRAWPLRHNWAWPAPL